MTTIEAARIINAIKCSMVTTPKEHEALTMAELVLFEQIDELVRCKDCKYLNKEEMRCFKVEGLGYRNVADDDFCSRGIKIDEVEND